MLPKEPPGAEPVAPPAARPTKASAPVRMAVAQDHGRRLVVYEVSRAGLSEFHSIDPGDTIGELVRIDGVTWLGPEELALMLWVVDESGFPVDPEPRVPEVVIVRGDEVTPVKMPSASAWAVPDPDELDPFFERHQLFATESGDPWLKICMWGYRGDEDPCVTWSHVPLRPIGPAQVEPPPDVRRAAAWKAAAPKGTQVRIESIGEYDERMVCVDGRGKQAAPDDQDYAVEIEVSWLGGSPPFYVARVVYPGASEGVVEHHLHQACRPEVLSKNVVHGPKPWWAHEDESGSWFVRHGGTQVGRVERSEKEWSDPVFAPPR